MHLNTMVLKLMDPYNSKNFHGPLSYQSEPVNTCKKGLLYFGDLCGPPWP